MDVLSEANLLNYLKRHYPHLYDFQIEIRKVVEATGFGDVSVSAIIRHKKVFSCDVSHWVKKLYDKEKT